MPKRLLGVNGGIMLCGASKNTPKNIQFWHHVFWFPKCQKTNLGKYTNNWFGPYKIQLCLPNYIMLLVILDKFDLNLILVNVNNLKPYQFLDEEAHTINKVEPMYWEGHKYIKMDDKDDEYLEEFVFMVHMVPFNWNFYVIDDYHSCEG